MNFRVYYFGLCALLIIVMTGCNLPANANNDDISLTSVADAGSQLDKVEATAEGTVEVIDEVDTDDVVTSENSSTTDDQSTINTDAVITNTTDNSNTANTTNTICTPRTDWVTYTVQSGDTLGQIAARVGSSVSELTQANCLSNANILSVGQQLYVPKQPASNNDGDLIVVTDPAPPDDRCQIHINTRTEIVNAPQGTGRTILGYLEAGSIIEPQAHFDGLTYYGFWYGEGLGWVSGQPTGDCSQLASTPEEINILIHGDQDPSKWACFFKPQHSLQLYSHPDSRYLVIGSIQAGTTYEVTAKSLGAWYKLENPLLSTYGWAQIEPQGSCSHLEQTSTCQFVGDSRVPIYSSPQIGSQQLGTFALGDRYEFVTYAGEWKSGDVKGDWIAVYYDPQTQDAAYIQNTGGHLEGNCPTHQ